MSRKGIGLRGEGCESASHAPEERAQRFGGESVRFPRKGTQKQTFRFPPIADVAEAHGPAEKRTFVAGTSPLLTLTNRRPNDETPHRSHPICTGRVAIPQ
jgi:hypothetical protein